MMRLYNTRVMNLQCLAHFQNCMGSCRVDARHRQGGHKRGQDPPLLADTKTHERKTVCGPILTIPSVNGVDQYLRWGQRS